MSRIVYVNFPNGGISGGQKVALRHVEVLTELGFDAVFWTTASSRLPEWLDHSARVEVDTPFRRDDILVLPEDAPRAIASAAAMPQRVVVFCQNHYYMASLSFDAIDRLPSASFLGFIASGRCIATPVARAFPAAEVHVVPAFADERLFKPAPMRRDAIAFVPRKRVLEARAIKSFFQKYHSAHRDLPWIAIESLPERAVAEVLGRSTLFLSLNRLEGPGMTLLEALASGCIAAGFTGIGSLEYANPTNGFWVDEDDCEAAADALARAAGLVRDGGSPLRNYLSATQATARQWSYTAFRAALEQVWSRLVRETRETPEAPARSTAE